MLGGEPLWNYIKHNDIDILDLCKTLHELGYNIWMWTGFEWDDVKNDPILQYVNTIITGRFELSKRNINLTYMGSSNQELHEIQ